MVSLLILNFSSSTAQSSPPHVVAHRGLLKHAPENTLSNFRACLDLRLGFEFDVQKSKDGVLVCLHDTTVDRTTNGTGHVSDLTLEHLKALDAGGWFDPSFAGERIPTIEEVFELIAEYPQADVVISVDLKLDGVEHELVRLAQKHKVLSKLLFIGDTITNADVRKELKAASTEARTAAVTNTPDEFQVALTATNADWVYFRYVPTAEEMQAVVRAKKKSFIAGPTVSGELPENWKSAAAVGMTAILTDYPLELRGMFRDE